MIAAIGVLLLIGIVKKNAIMMVDFALQAEREGRDTREAIEEACLLRFRPIMMTTFAALFGALPLAFGSGEGSELRHPLGIAIVGGLIVSQLLTLYTTPVVFIYLDNFGKWLRSLGAAITCAPAPRRWRVDRFAAECKLKGSDRQGVSPGRLRRLARVRDRYRTVVGGARRLDGFDQCGRTGDVGEFPRSFGEPLAHRRLRVGVGEGGRLHERHHRPRRLEQRARR